MKTLKTAFFALLLLLSVNTISAQYGNGYGGGYGGGYGSGYGGYGNGYGRASQMSQMPHETSKPKEIPAEVTAGKIVAYYKKELNLDALQEVVVTNIYVKSLKKQEALMKKESSDEDKTAEFKVLNEMTEMEMMEILNKDQKEKFKNLIEERKSKIEAQKH